MCQDPTIEPRRAGISARGDKERRLLGAVAVAISSPKDNLAPNRVGTFLDLGRVCDSWALVYMK